MIKSQQLLLMACLCMMNSFSYAQNEANVWYFGSYAGLDFNTGQPVVLEGLFHSYKGSASISDSSGNFLFATNGNTLWNRDREIMLNGDSLKGSHGTSQGSLIVQKPGSDRLYYVFTAGFAEGNPADYGLYYSIVDMALDGGLGAVTLKNILLEEAWDAADKIVAARQKDSDNIWIITRKFHEDGYAAFLLTAGGINTLAVFSPSVDRPFNNILGNIKISSDKKYLSVAYSTEVGGDELPDIEICRFNDATGQIELLYNLRNVDIEGCDNYEPWGVEFSPDSRFMYAAFHSECGLGGGGSQDNPIPLFQYDMQYIEDSALFYDTRMLIKMGPGIGLQLARDGKIYCSSDDYGTYPYVSVIHKPWVRGTGCDFEADAIHLGQGMVTSFFPNTLTDHLFRFGWEGHCANEAFVFRSNFIPEPENIRWSFGDPGAGADSISFDVNPVHYFSGEGSYRVKVMVEYPNGRIEHTSRVVSVTGFPHPTLGPDTLMCAEGDITLHAGNEPGVYVWSNGAFGINLNEITVSDTGWYWVRVTDDQGCSATDSIYIGLYPKAIINEDGLTITPTNCGGNNGRIMGLQVAGTAPFSFAWYDADSVLIANTLDIQNLAVGNYFLHIEDGNGCTLVSKPYTIEDGGDITITSLEKQDSRCNQNRGAIHITAVSGSTGNLFYSINNGTSWQSGSGIFDGLAPGWYFIRVKDGTGCERVYENNPVTIANIPGPEVSSVATTPETDHLSNGEIDITATANPGPVYYSIDGGASFQTSNGLFTNLPAGSYPCVVKDDYGCDTTFEAEVGRVITQLIEAIAGNGQTCIGNAAVVPLKVNNFTGILKFHVKLTYDTAMLTCEGYINVHPLLQSNLQAGILPGSDEVTIGWQGEAPATLEENAVMLELVFGAKKEGLSGIDWVAEAGESAFYNEYLEKVGTDYHFGRLRVYARPEISMSPLLESCEGGEIETFPYVSGGSGQLNYAWSGPGNFYSTEERIMLSDIQPWQAGIYTLKVTDTTQCTDSFDVHIIVDENPSIAFSGSDTILAAPGFVLQAGSGYAGYLWNTGDTTDAIQVSDDGLYTVEVATALGCKATDSVMIVFELETLFMPNAFSPNGDGLNDVFKPVHRYDYVNSYHLAIFSRWGETLFETGDIEQGWDGTFRGSPAPQGTYVYRIVYTAHSTGTTLRVKTGNFTLLR